MTHHGEKSACSRILRGWPVDTEITSPVILDIMKHHPAYREDDNRYVKRRGRAYYSYFLETVRLKRALGFVRAVDAKHGRAHRESVSTFRPVDVSALEEMLAEYVA